MPVATLVSVFEQTNKKARFPRRTRLGCREVKGQSWSLPVSVWDWRLQLRSV